MSLCGNGFNVLFPAFNSFPNQLWFFSYLQYKSFENTVGKGENARKEEFLLFPQCFLPFWRTFCNFSSNLKLSSANSLSLEESKICCFEKGYILGNTSGVEFQFFGPYSPTILSFNLHLILE